MRLKTKGNITMQFKIRQLLFLILILSNFSSLAQEDIFYRVSLAKEKIEIPYFPYQFSEVVDKRFNTEMIGCVQRGIGNRRGLANFENTLQLEFIALLKNSNLLNSNKESLVLIINSIWINEVTSYVEEKGIIDLNFSIAKRVDRNLVIISDQEISLVEEQIDATSNHDSRIARAIQKGLYNFQITPQTRYKNEPFENMVINTDSLIFKSKIISKGTFLNAKNLLTNTVTKNYPRFKEVDYLQSKALVRDTHSLSSIKKVYAFSDGEDIFINALLFSNNPTESRKGYLFHRVKLTGALVMINEVSNNSANMAAAVGFGLIGTALLSGAGNVKLIMDLRNGSMLQFNQTNLRYLLMEFPELLDKYKKMLPEVRDNYNTQIQFVKKMNELIAKK